MNPSTKEKCTNLGDVNVKIYRDEDYIYYYETDGLNCINDIDNFKFDIK